jgi:hypothetical protein
MSRNKFEQTWNFWHYSDSSTLDDEADRLQKIRSILDNLVEKFSKHYKPPQELSFDEAMIPWRGRLRFRTYNPGKLVNTEYWSTWCVRLLQAILAIWKYILQKAGSWKRPYFLS